MKFAIKALFRMKSMALLMILILSLSICLINNATLLNIYTVNKEDTFKNFFDVNNTFLVRIQASGDDVIKGYKYLDDIYSKFLKLKGNGVISNVYLYGLGPNVTKDLISKENGANPETFGNILVDKNFIERKSLTVSEGRSLNKDDFNVDYKSEPIPILLGNDYSGNYEIGYTVTKNLAITVDKDMNETYGDITFKVVGFVDENELISLGSKSSLNNNFIISNSVAIIPTVKGVFELSSSITLGDFGVFFEVVPYTDANKLFSSIKPVINKVSNDSNLEFNVVTNLSLKDDMASPIELLERDSVVSKFLSIILVMLSAIGIVAIMLGDIQGRKREFGIKITQGASYFVLFKELILADEPTGALDQETGNDILKLLKDINKEGKTVIIVTHDINVATQCNRIIKIVDGRVI